VCACVCETTSIEGETAFVVPRIIAMLVTWFIVSLVYAFVYRNMVQKKRPNKITQNSPYQTLQK